MGNLDTFFQYKSYRIKKLYAYIAAGVIFLLAINFFVYALFNAQKKNTVAIETEDASILQVESVRLASPKKISITFNDEVDQHELLHFLEISPLVPGELKKGLQHNEFVYEARNPFPESSTLRVKLLNGLKSKGKKVLSGDFITTLNTNVGRNQVSFMQDQIYGRVLSYSAAKPIGLNIKRGPGIEKPTVTIYKATPGDLLNFLIYDVKERKEGTYTTKTPTFLNTYRANRVDDIASKIVMDSGDTKNINLPVGIYYAEVTDSDFPVGSAFFVVNKIGMTLRQDDKRAVMSVFDLESGAKVASQVDAGFYNLESGQNLLARTQFNESGSVATPYEKKVDVVLATVNGETLFVPVNIIDTFADIRVKYNLDLDTQVFLYTDRPIYKPGDTVFYRGLVRYDNDANYKLAPNIPVRVALAYGSQKTFSADIQTDDYGSFWGNFVIPKDMKDSQYLVATTNLTDKDDYSNQATATFDIEAYTKPSFSLTVSKKKEEYLWNENIKFNVKGETFAGKPLTDKEVNYTLYAEDFFETEKKVANENFNISKQGGMCGGGGFGDYYGSEVKKGVVKLDSNGAGSVEFAPKELKLAKAFSQKFTLIVTKEDEKSGNTITSATNVVAFAGDFSIFFLPSSSIYQVGEEVVIPFYVEPRSKNTLLPNEFSYEYKYTTYSNAKNVDTISSKGNVSIDSEGKGIIRFPISKNVPKNSYGYVTIEGLDGNKNKVSNEKYISIAAPNNDAYGAWTNGGPDQTYLTIRSDNNSYVVGDTIVLQIKSPKEMDVLMSPERGRIYDERVIHLTQGENTLRIPVTSSLSPSIALTFSFFVNGKYHTEGVALNVPAMHKLMNVSITSDKDVYKPKDTAELRITTKDASGRPVSAHLSVGVVDEAIYALRGSATPPIHSAFYYYRDRSTNASSSLTPVGTWDSGGRGGGGGGGNINKMVDTLFWDPNIITNENGESLIRVPLSSDETVWRVQAIGSDAITDLGQASVKIPVRK